MRAGRGRFVTPTRDRIKRELGLSDAEANKLMRDLSLETILRQPGYYLVGTARWFWQLSQGTPERYRDHWQTRRDEGNREEWEANKEIGYLLGPPSPVVRIITFGFVNPRAMVHDELEKAMAGLSETLNRSLWWMSAQVAARVGFGLSLWCTWALYAR